MHDSSLYGGIESPIRRNLLTIVGRSLQQLYIKSNDVSAIGYFGVGSASLASRIIPAITHVRYPLGVLRVAGWSVCVSYSQLVIKNPHQIVEVLTGIHALDRIY